MSTAAQLSKSEAAAIRTIHEVQPALTVAVLLASDTVSFLVSVLVTAGFWSWFIGRTGYDLYFNLWPVLFAQVTVNALFGLYPATSIQPVKELQFIVTGNTILHLGLTATVFLHKTSHEHSRALLILIWFVSSICIPLGRGLVRARFSAQPWWGVPALVIGATKAQAETVRALLAETDSGLKLVGCLDDSWPSLQNFADLPVLGNTGMARLLVSKHNIRHAIVATHNHVERLSAYSHIFRHVIMLPDLPGIPGLLVMPRDLGGRLALELRHNLLIPFNWWTKRTMDVLGSLVIGMLALPIVGLAALIVKLVSPGPAFFIQEREGRGSELIRIYKLRTMHENADQLLDEYLERCPEAKREWDVYCKLKNDPRVIPYVGQKLRQWSIDELPQIWNVLRGEMSLVGPRPFPGYHLERFPDSFRILRRQVVPGLTGLWQIRARSDGNLQVQEKLDTYYIRNWSPWLDIYVLASTFKAVVVGKGAC